MESGVSEEVVYLLDKISCMYSTAVAVNWRMYYYCCLSVCAPLNVHSIRSTIGTKDVVFATATATHMGGWGHGGCRAFVSRRHKALGRYR